MSGIIQSKTKGNVFVETLPDPIGDAQVYVEYAPSANAFTGSTAGETSNVTFVGSGTNAKLKLVAAGTSLGTNVTIGGAGMTNTVNFDSLAVGTVYGGALATDAKGKIASKYLLGVTAVTVGNVTLNILNGRYGTVYGGGAGYGATVKGDVTINYGAGHVAGTDGSVKTIYGGGGTGSIVEGNVAININAIAAGKIGSIYAGGNNSVVKGNAVVTFSAGHGLYSFSGTVSGGGKGRNARVEGTSTLVFDNYIGDFKATIKEFQLVTFTGATSVTLTKAQNATMKGATYHFVITDETRGLTTAMLTLKKKAVLGKVDVTVTSDDFMTNGGTVILIASKYFKTAFDVNTNTFSVLNNEGNKIYSGAYELVYNFNKKLGGDVTFVFKGSSLIIDDEVKENVTLTDADETVNVVAGAEITGNIDMGCGDDTLNIQSGAKVYGSIDMGCGNDYLVIQKDALVTGTIDMGLGNDTLVLQENAKVSSEIFLRDGENMIILEEGSQHSGTIVFDANSKNTIHVNGGAISSVRGGDETTYNEIILSGIEGLGGGVGTWVTNARGVTTFQARELVLKGSTNDTVVLNKHAEVSAINFGKGEDTLVLFQDYRGDVVFEDGNDAIVAGTNLTLDGKTLKLRGTDNVLVVMNGCTVTITNMTVGSFAGGYDGIYLSQNAGLIYNNTQYIQNYVGHLDAAGDDVIILGAATAAPARIADYYVKETDGVVGSVLLVNSLTLTPGAILDKSSVFAVGSIFAFGASTVTDSNLAAASFGMGSGATVTGGSVAVGALNLEDGVSITDGKITTGNLDMAAGSSITGGSLKFDGVANVAGAVGTDLLGSSNDDTLNVLAGASFTTNLIDLGGGKDTVNFKSDFSNDALVIAGAEKITTAKDTLVTIGSAADATKFGIGKNSMLTEVIDQVITVGDWDKAVTFAADYTIVLTGVIDTDVALNGNTVVISKSVGEYFARNIALTGANTFMLGAGVETWYDWQQFSGDTALLGFNLGEGALFAVDGFVSDADRDSIKANTTLAQNAALGLGSWILIQDWSGAFSIDNLTTFSAAANIHTWDDLEVLAGGKVWGSIDMNDGDNVLVLNDGVVVNGSRSLYDFGTVNTGAGDDTLIAGAATVNGKITMGAGDNTIIMDGTTVNKAINQKDSVLEVGDAASNNEIAINNATLGGDVKFSGATEGVIGATTISGDLSFGAGDDEVIIDASTVNGDVTLNGGEFSLVNGTAINGDVDYVGGFTEVIGGDAAVTGDILFGTGTNILRAEGAFSANSIVGNAAAQGNSVTAEAGGSLTLNAGDLELTATGGNLVGADGGSINMDGDIILDGASNDVVLLNGGSINGLGALEMTGVNTLYVEASDFAADSVAMTGDGSNSIVETAGSIAVTDAIVMDGAVNTVDTDTSFTAGALFMMGAEENTVNTSGSMALTGFTDADGNVVPGVLGMSGVTNDLNVSGNLTADVVAMLGTTNTIDNSGTVALNGTANTPSVIMDGADNVIVNSGDFTAADIEMDNGDNVIANSDTFTAANIVMDGRGNAIANTDTFTAADITMTGSTDNVIANSGDFAAADIAMTGDENLILNAGTFAANNVALEGNENAISSLGSFTAAGDVSMTGTGRHSENTLDVSGDFTANSVFMDAYENEILMGSDAVLTAANGIVMNSRSRFSGTDSNEISLAQDFGTVANEELVIDDVNMVVDAPSVSMTGSSNTVELGLDVATNGTWDDSTVPASHLVSRATVGAFNVALAANGGLAMDGGVNTLDVSYSLDADQEGEILVNGDASIAVGDVTMTGSVNSVDASINLYAGEQAFIDMNGANVAVTLGDILMDTDPANGVNTDATKTNTVTLGLIENTFDAAGDIATASGEIRNATGAMTTTAGDISMFGAGAVNTLTIGRNATVENIAMGNIKGDQVSKSNTLTLDASGTVNGDIRLIAETNDVDLQGVGTIDNWFDVFGGVNTATIGKDVVVNDVLTFGGVYDQDGIGVDGYELIKNTANTVNVFGTVGGIDTSVSTGAPAGTINASEDIIRVNGGVVDGDILTGFGDDRVSLWNGASVTGAITMGDASIAAGNTDDNLLRVLGGSTVGGAVTMFAGEDNDLRVRGGSSIEGEVTMTAGDDNDLRISGASRIGASVTMVAGDDNDLRVFGASAITGAVTMTAGDDNDLIATGGSAIEGEVVMTADADNSLYLAGASRIGASVTMLAGDTNDADVEGSTVSGNVSMLALNDNTLDITTGFDVAGDLVGSHVEGDILMGSAEGDNYLKIAGDLQVVAGEVDVLTETKVDGKITMIANNTDGENHLRLEYASLGGDQVLMQGYLADVTIKTGDWKVFGTTTVDSSTYMDSFHMDSEVNTFTVEEGTVVITGEVEDPALAGYGMAFTGRENTLNVDAKGRLIMADTAADMSGPFAPTPDNVDPTTGRNGIYMGWSSTDVVDPTDPKYTFTGVTFYGTDPQNGQEVYTFDLTGGTPAQYSAVIADFNNINVDGKLLTGAVDMLGLDNTVLVTGPADSTVSEAYPRPPADSAPVFVWADWMNNTFSKDVLLMSTSTLWAESMSFSGKTNTLLVAGETFAPSMYAGAFPVSGASLMVGGDITMGNATVALYDKDGNYVKDGTVLAENNLIDAGGMDDFTFFKSGAISMTALYSNEAYISGYVFRGYSQFTDGADTFENQNPFFIKGEVNGSISQVVADGANVLELELVDVAGNIAQDATSTVSGTANTLEIHGTVIAELIDPATGLPFSAEQIVRSSAQDVEQVAHSADDAVVLDNSINATWTDLGNVAQRAENGSNLINVVAVNAGNVTMTADELDDAVVANNTIVADNVTRLEEVSNFGAITMTAADANTIDVAGFIRQAVVDPLTNELISAPAYDLSDIASLTMTGNVNTADLDLVNVAGDIAMTAGNGGNDLAIDGGIANAYTYWTDPTDPTSEVTVDDALILSQVGGSITMEATDAGNVANITSTVVAGDVTQNAYTDDATVVVGNTLNAMLASFGNITQLSENGSNVIDFVGVDAGDVTMTAEELVDTVDASNSIDAFVSNFGNITMTAADANTINAAGLIQQADVDPISFELVAAPIVTMSDIASLTMNGTTNAADLDLVDVAGDIAMTAGVGGNDLAINGGIVNGYAYLTDPTDPASAVVVPQALVYSEVGGDITMDATDAGNIANLVLADVAGDLSQTAHSTDATVVVGNVLNASISDIGSVTQLNENGSNAVNFIGVNAGNVSMTAEELDAAVVANNTLMANVVTNLGEVSNFGAITMTAADANQALVSGFIQQAVVVANELVTAPDYDLSDIGSLSMDGTSNMAILGLVDIAGEVSQTATTGGNLLSISGGLVAGYTYWTDIADPTTETTVAEEIVYSQVGGSVAQTAVDSNNVSLLQGVEIAGGVTQTTTAVDAALPGVNAILAAYATMGDIAQTAANGGNVVTFSYVEAGDIVQTAASLDDTVLVGNVVGAEFSELGGITQVVDHGSNEVDLNAVVAGAISMTAGSLVDTMEVANDLAMANGSSLDITMTNTNGSNTASLTNVDVDGDIVMDAAVIQPRSTTPFFLGDNGLQITGTFNDAQGVDPTDPAWVDANDDDFSTVSGSITMTSESDNNNATLTNTNVGAGIDISAGWTNTLTLVGAIGNVDVGGVATPTVFATTVGGDVSMEAFGTGDFTVDPIYGALTINSATNTLDMTAAVIDGDVTISGDVNLVEIDADSAITGTITLGDAGTVLNRANGVYVAGSVGGIAAADTASTAVYEITLTEAANVGTITTAAGDDNFAVGLLNDSITIDAVDLGAGANQAILATFGTESITINSLWATGGSLSINGMNMGTGTISVALVDTDTAADTSMTVDMLTGVTLTAIGSAGDTITFNTVLVVDYVGTVLGGTIVSGLNFVAFDMSGLTTGGAALVDTTNLTSWDALTEGGFGMDTTGLGAGTYTLWEGFDVANWGTGAATFSLANGTTLTWDTLSSAYIGSDLTLDYALTKDASNKVTLTIA